MVRSETFLVNHLWANLVILCLCDPHLKIKNLRRVFVKLKFLLRVVTKNYVFKNASYRCEG